MSRPSGQPRSDPAPPIPRGFSELVRLGCEEFVLKGIGLPLAAYLFHGVKLGLFVLGWMFFVSFTPGLGSPWTFGAWWSEGIAFQKAFLWGCLVEVLGFGCMSGPLGFHLWPPFTAFLHFLRPGTVKLAPFPRLPLFGGTTRTWLDVALYAAFVASLLRALVAPAIGSTHLVPIVALLPLCALGDKTIPLAARVEHHFAMIVCFLFAGNWIAACKAVQLAVWFWAGVSKLTVAFGYVVPVMTANNPFLRSPSLRRRLFVSYPDDLTPSRLGKAMAHAGTALELGAPLTLLFVTEPGPLLVVGMCLVLLLHGFIISNVPAGAVFEWNLLSVYAAFFLFVGHPGVSVLDVGSTPLALYLLVALVGLPLLGNLVPARVSFLVAMRYYAGNWAWNAWLFRSDSYRKLHALKRASPLFQEQLEKLLPAEAALTECRGLAFRSLHLQGRTLGLLLPKALGGRAFEEYRYVDSENVAGSVLGWNFGEGHLGDERLLACVQDQCGFEDGELRAIMVESQPILGSTLHWRIVDAKRGRLEEGWVALSELAGRKPWDYGPAMSDVVEIADYDPRWPSLFAAERDALAAAAGDGAVIEHVGSTAVPGLAAKPTIDLLVGVPRLELPDTLLAALGRLGYRHLGEFGIPGRQFFRKGEPPTHHVHYVRRDGDLWQQQLLFRDYLRAHPGACELYARVKRDLAARFRHDRSAYTASKAGVVTGLMEKAWRWKGAPLVVFDLEATCWPERTLPERMETIEVGAVRLGPDLEPQAEFQRFVRPSESPTLSDYCRTLTSIRQEDVDGAPGFPSVLAEFAAWVGSSPLRLASWSRYDLRQLEVDCARHGVDLPAPFESHLDLQALHARRRREGAVPMTRALEQLALVPEGLQHRALDDARNIARIARVLLASV